MSAAPWEAKANRLIASLSFVAWRATNVKADGSRFRKHRPYRIPELAQELVTCLGMRNRFAAEIEAKRLFLTYAGLGVLCS